MDNVTHSLFGALLAATMVPRGAGADVRRGALVAAVVGSNLPDADLLVLLTPASLGGGPLAYLLHHRGHSHTLLAVPLLAAVSAAVGARAARIGRASYAMLGWVSAAAVALHVAADALNDYGVHPFSPFDGTWYYGDALFIAEPTVWAALIPFVALQVAGPRLRRAAPALAALPPAALWVLPIASWPVAAAASAWSAAAYAAQRRWGGVVPAWAMLALAVAAFAAGSVASRARVVRAFERDAPGETLAQLVISPAPANPLCARVLALSVDREARYRVRMGSVGVPAREDGLCHPGVARERTARLDAVSAPAPGGIDWLGETSIDAAALRETAGGDCRFQALLRFARVPFVVERDGRSIAGDLRYDFEPDLGFAELALGEGRCLAWVPGWEPPVAALAGALP